MIEGFSITPHNASFRAPLYKMPVYCENMSIRLRNRTRQLGCVASVFLYVCMLSLQKQLLGDHAHF